MSRVAIVDVAHEPCTMAFGEDLTGSIMFEAQLHGKLAREIWIKSEDLLTSAVFGTLKNLPPTIASTLLQRARPLSGDARISFEPERWEFWPWWQDDLDAANSCEPDVVLSSSRAICLVEAKLYSDFGSEPGKRDQLDREWRGGEARADGREFSLLTVTPHLDIPRQEIESQFAGSATPYDPARIFWLSWAEIARHLDESRLSDSDRRWCADLLGLIEVLGIGPFRGFGDLVEDGRKAGRGPRPLVLKAVDTGYEDLISRAHDLVGGLHRLDWMKEGFPDAKAV